MDLNPRVFVTFYSTKEVNLVKIVRRNGYKHRYKNLCVILLDDTNNELDKKCTWKYGIYGEPYLVEETNSIEMTFNNVKNVKQVTIDFNKPTENVAQIAELYISGLH